MLISLDWPACTAAGRAPLYLRFHQAQQSHGFTVDESWQRLKLWVLGLARKIMQTGEHGSCLQVLEPDESVIRQVVRDGSQSNSGFRSG